MFFLSLMDIHPTVEVHPCWEMHWGQNVSLGNVCAFCIVLCINFVLLMEIFLMKFLHSENESRINTVSNQASG